MSTDAKQQEQATQHKPGKRELADYLQRAYTREPACDFDFIKNCQNLLENLAKATAAPADLFEGSQIITELKLLEELAAAERARLLNRYQEFRRETEEIRGKYSEEEAEEWLLDNFPKVYARYEQAKQS